MLLPLRGVRVLEFAHSVAAAFGAEILARLGAEVIKVKSVSPAGVGLLQEVDTASGSRVQTSLVAYLDRDKRVVTIDASTDRGAEFLRLLAERSNVMIWSPSALATSSSGFAPTSSEWLLRPVTVATSAYGAEAPLAKAPQSTFVAEHASGFTYHQASPVRKPDITSPLGGADWEVDLLAGVVVAAAALSGMRGANGSRPGPILDVATRDVLTYLLVDPFSDWLSGRFPGHRKLASDSVITIAGGLVWLLPCSDGHVMVSPREDHQWRRWSAVMGDPDWARDPATCGTRDVRQANALKLQQRMAAWSVGHKTACVFAKAQEQRVACFPISRPIDLLDNEQLEYRNFFSELVLGDARVRIPGLPFLMTTPSGDSLERGGAALASAKEDATDHFLATWLDATVDWVRMRRETAASG